MTLYNIGYALSDAMYRINIMKNRINPDKDDMRYDLSHLEECISHAQREVDKMINEPPGERNIHDALNLRPKRG